MPLVSFLMSNYKTPPAFLRRALDSMLSQTMTDFEAVIINDGVKDASYEVLQEYAARDQRIVLIENEENLGLPVSLNKGIERCGGKYIARMDTDDISYQDRLEKQVAFMEAHPDVMFAGAWTDLFTENENEIIRTWRPVMCSQEEFRIRLLFANDPLLSHPTVIFKTEFLKTYNLRYSEDPLYRYCEDYEMWTRCADFGTPAIMEFPVLKYRFVASDFRLTVGHARDMEICEQNVQLRLLDRLGISDSEYDPNLNAHLFAGRKPYNIRYKRWMDRILRQNRRKKIYDQKILKRLLHDRWYSIVFYAVAHEADLKKRIGYLSTLYPDRYLRFFQEFTKRVIEKNGKKGD